MVSYTWKGMSTDKIVRSREIHSRSLQTNLRRKSIKDFIEKGEEFITGTGNASGWLENSCWKEFDDVG